MIVRMRACRGFVWPLLTLLTLGCSHDWDSLLPSATGDGGGSGGSGASGGGSGGTGAGGSAGAAGSGGGVFSCPAGMIAIAGGFCIDPTETTNGDYAAFLASGPDPSAQTPPCDWNTSFDPSSGWPVGSSDNDRPVTFVDWCDAAAYCQSRGKRLCGALDGGSAIVTQFDDAAQDEWFHACSDAGANIYPYPGPYDGTACNGVDFGVGASITVGSATGCQGGTQGLFDMSGNIYEWEDSCTASSDATDACRMRGGAYNNNAALLRCDVDATSERSTTSVTIGIRCCADGI